MKANDERSLGVVCVAPFWSQSDNLNADSCYVYLRQLLPELVRQTERTIFLVLFPDPDFGSGRFKYRPDGLQSERIRFVRWSYDTAMQTSVLGYPVEDFKRVDLTYGPNLYFLQQVELGPLVYGGYYKAWADNSRPTLVAQQMYIPHKTLTYKIETQLSRTLLQMSGCLASDMVVYPSQYAYGMAKDTYGDYLSTSALSRLADKSTVNLFGMLDGNEPYAPEATSDDKPVFVYNHRFQDYKDPQSTFLDVFGQLKQSYDFEIWATHTSGQRTRPYHFDRDVYEPLRHDYLRRIAVPAINTINSVHETYCISMVDSMALGHLCVVPRRVTFPELFPEDYPFFFDTVQEQRNMLAHILDTWPVEYNKWRAILSQHARTNFSLEEYAKRYLSIFHKAELKHRIEGTAKDNTVDAVSSTFDSMKLNMPYPLSQVAKSIRERGNLAHQSMPLTRVIREAIWKRDDIDISWQQQTVLTRKT